jgi:hypothetical protein
MAVEPPDPDEFDRDDLVLSPELHREQAKMAAARGEEYDPYEFEKRARDANVDIDPIEDVEPVDGGEELIREWKNADD